MRRPMMRRLGKRAEVELRDHFRARNSEPNKRRWPKQRFWGRIRRATAFSGATDTQATVTIADPAMAAKIHGATIRPVEAKALAIPLRKEAYGKRPSAGLIPNLFVLRTKKGAFLAASTMKRRGRRRSGPKGQRLTIYWKLVKSTTVPRDPRALPEQQFMGARLRAEAERFIQSKIT